MQTLVSEARYRQIAKDLTTPQTDVLAALEDAVNLVAERLHRAGLERATYTEILPVHPGGDTYPSVCPLVATTSSEPVFTGFDPDAWVGPKQAIVTYTGGWTAETLPQRLLRAVVTVAKDLLSTSEQRVPAGATDVALGDARVAYARPTEADLPPGVWQSIKGYAHHEILPY